MIQGFVHARHQTPTNAYQPHEPLPDLDLTTLQLSAKEVAQVFHLPLSEAVNHSRLKIHPLRRVDTAPYWAVDVSDLLSSSHIEKGEAVISEEKAGDAPEDAIDSRDGQAWKSDPLGRDEVGGGREGRLEVWGLTGWYLNVLLKALHVY
jgi:hypothetical protein